MGFGFRSTGGIIEGELRFVATSSSPDASYGESARFEDGRFRAIVDEIAIR
jgi:hypothetical protein